MVHVTWLVSSLNRVFLSSHFRGHHSISYGIACVGILWQFCIGVAEPLSFFEHKLCGRSIFEDTPSTNPQIRQVVFREPIIRCETTPGCCNVQSNTIAWHWHRCYCASYYVIHISILPTYMVTDIVWLDAYGFNYLHAGLIWGNISDYLYLISSLNTKSARVSLCNWNSAIWKTNDC